ncbi:MAG: hypothetical protein EA385_03695 [Salinarimonadaceae bacterium]|nr:MAG: hypothetical protein EA385_03695 [Salinarimonadaceae bacterium]
MIPILVAAPAVEPISLAEARAYVRLDDPEAAFAEDGLIESLVAAARLAVEAATRLKLIAQTWRLSIATPPASRAIRLPLSPVAGVIEIRVFDGAGLASVVDPQLYRLRQGVQPPVVELEQGFPSAPGGMEIDVVAGFGEAPASVPAPLRQAIRALVARWFEERGDGAAQAQAALPADVALAIAPYRDIRLR